MIILITTFLFTGLVSGLIAGLLGVGGGIIIVPVSYFVLKNLGYPIEVIMHVAIASSLTIILLTSLSSIRSHLNIGNVEKTVIKKWYKGILIGSLIGSFFASKINGEILVIIFISLACIISINMFFQNKIRILREEVPNSSFINLIISGSIGFLSSIMGIGGGSFSVPTLIIFSKKMHKAVGTSSVIGFFIALPSTISYIFLGLSVENLPPYSIGYVNILIVSLVASTSIFTANIGARLTSRVDKDSLKKIFAIFLLFTCISLVIEYFIF